MPDGLLNGLVATFHPYAELFPPMIGEDFNRLVADIKANGLRIPLITVGNAILDGRNRYRACLLAGVPIRTEVYLGNDPLSYILSVNLRRRHLNESQRAMVAQKLETTQHGGDRISGELKSMPQVTRTEAADLLHVSPRSVADAKKVRERCIADLAQRVEAGEVTVFTAAKIADLPVTEQTALAGEPEAVLRSASKIARRAERECELAASTRAASAVIGRRLYGVIYADPPWQFSPYSRDTGLDRAADNHYPTMSTAEICGLTVPAAHDAVLFLWATVPMLAEAFAVITAWGFHYKSGLVWVKDKIGTGYWARNRHELLLIATKGDMPAPPQHKRPDSVITHATERHSAKPACFAEMIEEMFPNAALLEMFARGPRLGWDTWGNEAEASEP